ncbi:MAG: shikimate dehydrogenase [Brevundimonas sp.]|nr:MAG: shikimate dehydrogenase [Brevundimonas sp.]
MSIAGVIGSPARHSLSPIIHNAWLRAAGLKGGYRLYDIAESEFEAKVAELRAEGLAGLNVTLPFKERALALADRATAEARQAGAANVLVFGEGEVFADNTDGAGVLEALSRPIGGFSEAKTLVLIGAGGAAAGAVMALRHVGARIRLVNRTRAKAEALAARIGPFVEVFDWDDMASALLGADGVINATSLGLEGRNPLVIDFAGLPAEAPVMDMVYKPLETAFLAAARQAGHPTVDGLDMLIGQARPSFQHFFGVRPPEDLDVRALCLAALERRG